MKNENNIEPSYDEFEPYCRWKKEQDSSIFKATHILEIQLNGFKKEEVKIELGKDGFLCISGERPVGRRLQRFLKKIDASKYETEDLKDAEFEDCILRLRLPTKSSAISCHVGSDKSVGILLSWPKINKTTNRAAATALFLLLAYYMYKYSECTNFLNWFK